MRKSAAATDTNKGQDPTATALLHAGLDLFSRHGFDSTSTRMLCKQAKANISAITYYYQSKQGLYHAVIRHLVEKAKNHTCETMRNIEHAIGLQTTATEAVSCLTTLMCKLAEIFVESEEVRRWAMLVVREQANPTDAFDILYEGHMRAVHTQIAELVGICLQKSPDSDDVVIRSHALFGQLLVFCLSRESILRSLSTDQLNPKHYDTIYRVLIEHTQACVTCRN